MSARALTTGATLVVAAGLLVIMAVWGYHAMTSPIPGDDTVSSTGPTCPPEDQKVTRYVHRGEVTVSVYNAGKHSGTAQATADLLESAGFKPGEVGNAPDGIDVKRVAVYTTEGDDPDAELVARALGQNAEVVRTDEDYGPGVDVVVGNKFALKLDPSAPNRLALPEPVTTCD
jgi:hypothetical protein